MTPETCPHCGAELPRRARVCPECGADERTGWSEEAQADRLDLPSAPEEFDYDEYVAREFGGGGGGGRGAGRNRGRRLWWWWVALVVLAAVIAAWVF